MNTKTRLVLAYLAAYREDYNGATPETYEIKEACNIRSDETVAHHLRVLEEYGCIERQGDEIITLRTHISPLPKYSKMTERIFQCIYLHIKAGNYPSIKEIAEDCQTTQYTAGQHVRVLESHGKIIRIPYIRRSIRLA